MLSWSFDTSYIWLNMPFFVHAEIYPQTPSQFYHQGCFRTWHSCLVCKFNKLINKQKKGVKTLKKTFFHMLCQGKKSRSRLFPGSTFYHSRNLRHSSIHELVTVRCFPPHNREKWSHSLTEGFYFVGMSSLRSPSLLGWYCYCFPLIFFRLYLIKVRIGKLILWCFSSAEIWVQITLRLLIPKSFPVLGI